MLRSMRKRYAFVFVSVLSTVDSSGCMHYHTCVYCLLSWIGWWLRYFVVNDVILLPNPVIRFGW